MKNALGVVLATCLLVMLVTLPAHSEELLVFRNASVVSVERPAWFSGTLAGYAVITVATEDAELEELYQASVGVTVLPVIGERYDFYYRHIAISGITMCDSVNREVVKVWDWLGPPLIPRGPGTTSQTLRGEDRRSLVDALSSLSDRNDGISIPDTKELLENYGAITGSDATRAAELCPYLPTVYRRSLTP